jgi:hypothetical protein
VSRKTSAWPAYVALSALHHGYSFEVALSREVAMACNSCETNFQGSQTLVVSVARSGSRAVLSIGNQGRNIVLIRRILLCVSFPGGGGTATLYLRAPPEGISWMYPSTYLEPGVIATYYIWNGLPAGSLAQAQAEYIEIEGRSRSCPTTI